MVRKRKVAAVDDKRKGDLVKIVLPLLARSHSGKVVQDHSCVQSLVPGVVLVMVIKGSLRMTENWKIAKWRRGNFN